MLRVPSERLSRHFSALVSILIYSFTIQGILSSYHGNGVKTTWSGIKAWRQSSTAFKGYPENALDKERRSTSNCFPYIHSNEDVDNQRYTKQHYAQFDGVIFVNETYFQPFYSKVTPTVSRTIEAYVGVELNIKQSPSEDVCGRWDDPLDSQHASSVHFNCKKPVVAAQIILNVNHTYSSPNRYFTTNEDDIVNCRTQVWGYKINNFAYHKPTKQSHGSCPEGSFCSDQVVDGVFVDRRGKPGDCTLPTESKSYQWWRVDLIDYHIVKALTVYGDKTDIEIRVGNGDIAHQPFESHFKDNMLCRKILSDVRIITTEKEDDFIKCAFPTLGRYVSIQRVTCAGLLCNDPSPLKLCEVAVHGFPLTITSYGISNQFVEKEYNSNSPASITVSQNTNENDWNVLKQSFKDTVAVKNVELYFSQTFLDSASNISLKVTVDSEMCYNDNLQLSKRYALISCNFLFGRVISVTYKRPDGWDHDSLTAYAKILEYKLNDAKMNFSAQRVKPPPEEVNSWIADNSSIAMEQYSMVNFVKHPNDQVRCSYTLPGDPYPWWRIEFETASRVFGFEVEVEKNGDYDQLHDVEVRVGYNDLADAPRNVPFTGNTLCYATGSDNLLKTSEMIECQQTSSGKFFSIQMVRRCSNPSICSFSTPNVLKLCFVKLNAKDLNL